jgi:chromosome segregation ATPase
MTEVTLEMLGRLMERNLTEQAALRSDLREVRSLALALSEQGRRVERRVEELRDDLELMLKTELMGRLGHFEAQIERRLEDMTR